jgi:deazaflavin-dependent oxidoreductase (nitroreductase family)
MAGERTSARRAAKIAQPYLRRATSFSLMRDQTAKTLSTIHTLAYRLTRGRVGRRLVNNDMLLLTTRGRKTGRSHTVPLLYLRDGDNLVVIASWGGRPNHPDWYANLTAHSRATVQVVGKRWEVNAEPMEESDRAQWWPRVLTAYDGYDAYQSRTKRPIPVVRLRPAF